MLQSTSTGTKLNKQNNSELFKGRWTIPKRHRRCAIIDCEFRSVRRKKKEKLCKRKKNTMLEGSLQHKTIVRRQRVQASLLGNDLFVNPETGKIQKTDRRTTSRLKEMISIHLRWPLNNNENYKKSNQEDVAVIQWQSIASSLFIVVHLRL